MGRQRKPDRTRRGPVRLVLAFALGVLGWGWRAVVAVSGVLVIASCLGWAFGDELSVDESFGEDGESLGRWTIRMQDARSYWPFPSIDEINEVNIDFASCTSAFSNAIVFEIDYVNVSIDPTRESMGSWFWRRFATETTELKGSPGEVELNGELVSYSGHCVMHRVKINRLQPPRLDFIHATVSGYFKDIGGYRRESVYTHLSIRWPLLVGLLAVPWLIHAPFAAVGWARIINRRRRSRRLACRGCGYDLHGLPVASACPECGEHRKVTS